mgnify:CR=1 FL=1
MYLTALISLAARASGKRIILHHHTNAHITQRVRRMRILSAFSGKNAFHVTVCKTMSSDLFAAYPRVCRTLEYSNIDSVDPALLALPRRNGRGLTLGFMSNLTVEKGIGSAIDTFREALRLRLADRIVLAGPCNDEKSRQILDEAMVEFAEKLVYLGPVYGADKLSFFEMIDLFLFPSTYANETQGIVNLEALAAGLPIVAFGQCCIPSDLDVASCTVVEPSGGPEAFSTAVLQMSRRLKTEPPEHVAEMSRERFRQLQLEHEQQKAALLDVLG